MKKPEVDWTFLDRINTTAFKGWSAVWLWVFTAAVWGLAVVLSVVLGKALPDAWLATWLTGLAAYSGIGALQFKAMRDSDYTALKIKAEGAAPKGKEGEAA